MRRTTARRGGAALASAVTTLALLASPALAGPAAGPAVSQAEESDGKLLLVLDASGSMGDPDQAGTPKIEAARTALEAVVDGLADDQLVGLRLFASTVSESDTAAACADSELVVPIGSGNQGELDAAVAAYRPFGGETPIGHALERAGRDLGSEGPRSVLLVSDGLSTCDPDPCEVAEELTDGGIDVAVHVVGLDVDSEARRQLQCIAAAGNGTYIDATDSESLTSALTQVSTRAFRPFSIAGEPVVGTTDPATAPTLVAGQYTDRMAQNQEVTIWYRIRRTVPGSTLQVGMTVRPERGGTSSYQMALESPDGRGCGAATGMPWGAGMTNTFGTAAVQSTAYNTFEGPCQDAEELLFRVKLGGNSEPIFQTPVEIVVTEDPPISNREALPGPADGAKWQEMEPGAPAGKVVAGASLNDAPRVEPGQTYSSELTRGEIVFFRVPVEYGQHLQALVEFPTPQGALAESIRTVSDVVDLAIISPTRGEVHNVLADTGELSGRALLQDDRPVRAAATTDQIRWANRGSRPSIASGSVEGDYFVAVSLTSQDELLLPVPFTITTELVGEVGGIPEYISSGSAPPEDETPTDDDAGTVAPRGSDQQNAGPEPTGDVVDAGPVVEGADDRTPQGLLIALAAVGLALLAAGVVVLTRVRRT